VVQQFDRSFGGNGTVVRALQESHWERQFKRRA
jgi:hypothetical protein